MRTITTDTGTAIQIYSSAKEMPIHRYTAFQKYLLMESGIGASMESIGTHFSKLHSFIVNAMHEEAKKEAENLHFSFFSILNEINYQSLAFACMVYSIGDTPITDISDENLPLIVKQLGQAGVTLSETEELSDEIKKKS